MCLYALNNYDTRGVKFNMTENEIKKKVVKVIVVSVLGSVAVLLVPILFRVLL